MLSVDNVEHSSVEIAVGQLLDVVASIVIELCILVLIGALNKKANASKSLT